ncbi:DUF4302 domain-containing protein [Chitinophaga arvensicola]|uniref:DUF4302 domain-containing protein n=1 Tax=Chitinophaga arvensicola TaxID=29529 RepID=A0A1I0SBF9_9BACT|nr:DUF4302 domain-containing protein [Chitinophaga arvensicola]SEW53995.1 protein of unknown function [Chitinophaga arvensicola]
MKKIWIYLLGATVLFTGCSRKSDLNIDGTPTDVRLAQALATYQQKLTEAPYGWVFTEYTNGTSTNGGVTRNGPKAIFTYYMKFGKDEQVSMISDFNPTAALVFNNSGYRVKAVQRPTLIFDTYSYIHLPCDPDASVSHSPYGNGFNWGTDFEFAFADNIPAAELGDTIRLTGNLNNATGILVKATQAQQQTFTANGIGGYTAFNQILNYFKRVAVGGTTLEITPGVGGRSFDLKTTGSQTITNVGVQYTATSILLESPVTVGSVSIKSFDNLIWNGGTGTISASINGNTPVTITPALAPLTPEPDVALNFYIAGLDGAWLAGPGFHVRGVDDAYNLLKLPYPGGTYLAMVYLPGRVNGGDLDVLSPYFTGLDDGYPYVYAGGIAQPGITQGRLTFRMLNGGDPVVNPPALIATNRIFNFGRTAAPYTTPSPGFYIVRKADGVTFDMVTAGDALGWISWALQ